MVDVEASSSTSNNPYSGADPNVLPLYHPINILWRLLYMTIALWGLHHFQAYETIIHSPKIRHEWFKIGLAATVGESSMMLYQKNDEKRIANPHAPVIFWLLKAILFIKAYVELYAGKIQKKQVNCEFAPWQHLCQPFLAGFLLLNSISLGCGRLLVVSQIKTSRAWLIPWWRCFYWLLFHFTCRSGRPLVSSPLRWCS